MIGRMMVSALALMGVASAQEPATLAPAATANGTVAYGADFFAQFTPSNAYDMVRRVPGFTLDEGEERRGFSGAAGNVLIDGRRPSAKSQTLQSILQRIPASQVTRIELIRDTSSTADAAGQSTLINVVRTQSAGGGVWEGTLFYQGDRTSPRGNASWTGRTGSLDYALGASRTLDFYPLGGYRYFTEPDGDLIFKRVDRTPRTFRRADFNAEATFPLLGGSMRVNGQIDRFNFRLFIDQHDTAPNGAPIQQVVDRANERRQNEEIGLNFDREFGPFAFEFIGVATRGHYANDEESLIDDSTPFNTVSAQRRRNEFAETIGRSTLSWPISPALRLDVGGELAFNSLDATQSLTVDRNGSGPVAITLPAANVLVEEERTELFATLAWIASTRWTVETTLAGESSTLTQSGDTSLETELAYFKPSLQVIRRIGENGQVRARLYRDVDQLNFTDFVSAAALADALVVGGNPNLRPETSWRGELATDWRYGEGGAWGVRIFHHELEDASDVVPVGPAGARFDAPGNIGEGWVHGLQLTATVPLDALLPGARLTVDNVWQDSEVTDPVTGRPRVISRFIESTLNMRFRQDLPQHKFAWGADYFKQAQNNTYRINETDAYEEGPFLTLYAETTAIDWVKVRLFAENVLDSPFTRRREFYNQDRNGPLVQIEDRLRTRNWGTFWGITLSGAF